MELKELSNTSVIVPEIGIGTWRYKGGVAPLQQGIRLGATLIDTAEGYYTEDVVGEAVKGMREEIFIATKVSGRHLAYDQLLRAAENSLYELGTDYIDLYQIHWPNPAFPLRDTMRAMGELADRGVIRFIGVSNFDISELEEAQSYLDNYKIVSNQILYNLNNRSIERDLLPYCTEKDIAIFAYTPIDDGHLTNESRTLTLGKLETLKEISEETKKTFAQIALNWCTSRPNVFAIPKSNSITRVIENCQASGWRLSADQLARLNKAFM